MQFIPSGPDIPNELLDAHEAGRVVFFCGAGVSYPAGLPGFEGLVNKLLKRCGYTCDNPMKTALDKAQFDIVIDLLERGITGRRNHARQYLPEILKPPRTLIVGGNAMYATVRP